LRGRRRELQALRSSWRLINSPLSLVYWLHTGKSVVVGWWQTAGPLGHYGNHSRPQVADRGTPLRMDKRVAADKEGAADKQCLGEGILRFHTGADGARSAFSGKFV